MLDDYDDDILDDDYYFRSLEEDEDHDDDWDKEEDDEDEYYYSPRKSVSVRDSKATSDTKLVEKTKPASEPKSAVKPEPIAKVNESDTTKQKSTVPPKKRNWTGIVFLIIIAVIVIGIISVCLYRNYKIQSMYNEAWDELMKGNADVAETEFSKILDQKGLSDSMRESVWLCRYFCRSVTLLEDGNYKVAHRSLNIKGYFGYNGKTSLPQMNSEQSAFYNEKCDEIEKRYKAYMDAQEETDGQSKATTETVTEEAVEETDPRDDYPEEYRDILIDAESERFNYAPLFHAEKSDLQWIKECHVSGNKFSDFIAEKREKLHIDEMSELDREIFELMLKETRYGCMNLKERPIKSIVVTGFNNDGSANLDNRVDWGEDKFWFGRCIYMNDDEYIYYHSDFVEIEGYGSNKDNVIAMDFQWEYKSDMYAWNFVNASGFNQSGMVTPENVKETFSDKIQPVYTQINPEFSEDMIELLYVYGLYATKIGSPRESAKIEAEKAEYEVQDNSDKKSTTSNKTTSKKTTSGSRKTETTAVDPMDHDIDLYYEDYKEEFEDEDDAWDDFEDNEDMWEDY